MKPVLQNLCCVFIVLRLCLRVCTAVASFVVGRGVGWIDPCVCPSLVFSSVPRVGAFENVIIALFVTNMNWHVTKCLPLYRKKVKRRHCCTGFSFPPPGETISFVNFRPTYERGSPDFDGRRVRPIAFNFNSCARVPCVAVSVSGRAEITETDEDHGNRPLSTMHNVHPIGREYNIRLRPTTSFRIPVDGKNKKIVISRIKKYYSPFRMKLLPLDLYVCFVYRPTCIYIYSRTSLVRLIWDQRLSD